MCRPVFACSVDERGRRGSFFDSAIIITSVLRFFAVTTAGASRRSQAAKLKSVLRFWTRKLTARERSTIFRIYRHRISTIYVASFVLCISTYGFPIQTDLSTRRSTNDVCCFGGARNRRRITVCSRVFLTSLIALKCLERYR